MDTNSPRSDISSPSGTVVIPTFNRSRVLSRAIESVLEQSFTDFELLVVDDAGNDDTEDVVRVYNDSRIRYIKRPSNGGISSARNTGIADARGNWITFLDDDDQALPGWLSTFERLLQNPGVGIACVGAVLEHVQTGMKEIILPRRLKPIYENAFGLFRGGTFASRAVLLRDVGGFAENLLCSHATELAIRLIRACHGRQLVVKSCSQPFVQINRENAGERPSATPAQLLAGSTYILETHRTILKRSPDAASRYLAIAGVAAARLGRYKECRKFFFQSLVAYPWNIKSYIRFLLSLNGSIARNFWQLRDRDVEAV
jgi:glycosyltransferase involved in cell wall biosynthesis